MLQTVQIPTPDGIKEYPFVGSSVEYESAVSSGEISEGMDIVYRHYLVHIIHDSEMLVLTKIVSVGANDMPGSMAWSFTVNGVPVDANGG